VGKQKFILEVLDNDCNLFQYILPSIYFWLLQQTWLLNVKWNYTKKTYFIVLYVIIFIYIFYIAQ